MYRNALLMHMVTESDRRFSSRIAIHIIRAPLAGIAGLSTVTGIFHLLKNSSQNQLQIQAAVRDFIFKWKRFPV